MCIFASVFKNTTALAVLLLCSTANAQQLAVYSTLHSIGYRVELPPGYDADSTAVTEVRYRAAGGNWQPGFPAARLAIGEFGGSLFQLDAATACELEVSIVDSFPVFKKDVLSATATTRALPDVHSAGDLKWVSPGGSGSLYSASSPGNLQTLLAAGLPCGTTVLLKGGNYPLGDLTLHLTEDCPETAPVVIMAAPGEIPVLDGGSYDNYAWTQDPGDTTVWRTTLPAGLEFNALCLVDGERMYPYAFLTPPGPDPAYPSLQTLGYDLPGFYRNKQNQVFIKTPDHRNINDSEVIFSKKFSCLTVEGHHKNVRLHLKGIGFKYYAKGLCNLDIFGNPVECFPSATLRFRDASRVVVDSCTFDFCNFPVFFEGDCNENIVMNCRITDGTGYWSHAAFKRTIDVVAGLFDPAFGTYGRYLENAGIHFRPAAGQTVRGNVVWKNTVTGVVTGIGLGFPNGSVMADSDISENRISWCYDAIDALGEHRNTRIWGNEAGHCPVGISLISREQKPVYVFRNVLHHLDQRQNYQTDPNFLACDNTETHQSWSTALKLNAGDDTGEPTDLICFIHNTVHSTEPLAFNLYLWQPTWKVLQLRNNLFYAEGNANFFFDGVGNQPLYSLESVGDNVVNPAAGVLGIVRPQHGLPDDCSGFGEPGDLQNGLSVATGSPYAFFEKTRSEQPQFADPENGDFRLLPASPLIDQGVAVPGLNNQFAGTAPDIGAYEMPGPVVSVAPPGREKPALAIFPNPSGGTFWVRLDGPGNIAELQVRDLHGRLLAGKQFSGGRTAGIDVTTLPPGAYLLKARLSDGAWLERLVLKQ